MAFFVVGKRPTMEEHLAPPWLGHADRPLVRMGRKVYQ